MNDTVIRVTGLGKNYEIGAQQRAYTTLRDQIAGLFRAPFQTSPPRETIWALKDVSFEVNQGDVVGIIGRNGAGKSTLLKLLSRITEPTVGEIALRGRVGSLLEVGTGFHAELSGRENIFLNGAVLGMRRNEILKKFDEIVAFAEVEKFIDTAVKHYSSGMYMRLAFAVAAHLEPEILIVDEVLAVGDAAFQRKSLGKIGDIAKDGRTVLFVSHNMTAVRNLCSYVLWLEQGHLAMIGSTDLIVGNYLQSEVRSKLDRLWEDPTNAPGNDKIRVRSASVRPLNQLADELFTIKTALRFEFEFWNYTPDTELNFSVLIYTMEGTCVFNTVSDARVFPKGLVRGRFTVPEAFLNDAIYTVRLYIVAATSVPLVDLQDILTFEVHEGERTGNWYGKWIGAVRPQFVWDTEFLGPN
jgi:lipopolysaccharide transport system ATP-binding protein